MPGTVILAGQAGTIDSDASNVYKNGDETHFQWAIHAFSRDLTISHLGLSHLTL